jgi:hypothetical protein
VGPTTTADEIDRAITILAVAINQQLEEKQ